MALDDDHPAILVSDLVVRHGDHVAVDQVSFSVYAGSIVALIGPNGAGKSSTLDACQGYRRPDGGTVWVFGADPHDYHDGVLPYVGVMLQEGGLHPDTRAGELLDLMSSFSAHPSGSAGLLRLLGLVDVAGTRCRHLSGGERQRLGVALAVCGRPWAVMLDEPTSGMDVYARRTTRDLLRRLRDANVAVLISSHLLDEVERLADEVIVLDHGRVVASGSPAELTGSGEDMRLVLLSSPGLRLDRLRPMLRHAVVAEREPGSYVIEGVPRSSLAATIRVAVDWCTREGAEVRDLSTDRCSLEDAFLRLTSAGSP